MTEKEIGGGKKHSWATFSIKYVNGIILFFSARNKDGQKDRLLGIFSIYVSLYMLVWEITSDYLGHNKNRV